MIGQAATDKITQHITASDRGASTGGSADSLFLSVNEGTVPSNVPSPARFRCKCSTSHCRNRRRKDGRDCHKCHQRAWRKNQPERAAFATLRDHARERGIEFRLTFDQFAEFARACAYIDRRGLFGPCLTVDRVDNLLGYLPTNIQPLTRSKNSEKRAKQDAVRQQAGNRWRLAA